MQTWTKIFSKVSFLAGAALLTLLATSAAWADTGARVTLQPAPAEGGLVKVEVLAENITDLYGLELHLKYDPTVLELQDSKEDQAGVQVEPGTLLPLNQGFVVANQAIPTEGKVTYAITLLNPAPPVSGSGPIARLTFKTLQNVPATITVEQAILVSVNLQTIPVQTAPLTIGGAEQAAPANYPWWLVAAIILIVGLMAVGVVIALKNVRKPAVAPVQARPAPARRPSTFK